MRQLFATVACCAFVACGGKAQFETDGPPCLSRQWQWRAPSPASVALDLLFVVDSADGGADEQAAIVAALPTLVEWLTVPIEGGEGAQVNRGAIQDIHLGVITMDAGVQGHAVATCLDAVDGDDGVLIRESGAGGPDCADDYPSYLSYEEGDDPELYARDAGCLASVGDQGCQFLQPLEAMRRALVDHDAEANLDFLRSGSILAVVLVTDADDCSTLPADQVAESLFDAAADLGPMSLRCARLEATHLVPVDDYVEALMALRSWRPRDVVAAAIAGVPPASSCLEVLDPIESYDCLLAEPAMQLVENAAEDALVPSCGAVEGDPAEPPRRIVSFLRGVSEAGGGTLLRSSCSASLEEPFESLAELIDDGIHGSTCAGYAALDGTGGRSCYLRVASRSIEACPPGHIDLGWHDGWHRCQVCQRGDGDERSFDVNLQGLDACKGATEDGNFWEYVQDDECPSGGALRFHGEAAIPPRSIVDFRCFDSSC